MALEAEFCEAVAEVRVGEVGCFPEVCVDRGAGETGDRIDLVEEDSGRAVG